MTSKPETTAKEGFAKWRLMLGLAGAWIVVDQVTKFLAVKHLTRLFEMNQAVTLSEQISTWLGKRNLDAISRGPLSLIDAFWGWRYAENPGAAWSFAAGWPDSVRVPFFHVVSLIAIVLIAYYFAKLKTDQKLLRLALSMIMGGAFGNLLDRLARGYVIDFIDWHLADPDWLVRWKHWPTFNVADMGISTGVALIALDTILVWWATRKLARAA